MNREHAIKLLQSGADGVAEWNRWRSEGSADPPFLSAIDLRGADLSEANLRFVSLGLARLDGVNLAGADLSGASLRQADLYDADLSGAILKNADVRAADLTASKLVDTEASGADFGGADLNGAALTHANLSGANLTGTDLSNTDMSAVDLRNARLIGTKMTGSRLTNAEFAGTVISCGLDGVTDLDLTIHHMPSPIAVSSVLSLTGNTPLSFLRGCGLRPEEIEYFKGVLIGPIEFNACFLTYHEADEELANRIHRDLQDSGVRCWKRRHRCAEFEIGDSGDIEHINCGVNRMILLASKNSLNSPSILREIGWALRREEFGPAESAHVLMPIEVDEFASNGWEHLQRDRIVSRFIAKSDDSYADVLSKLLGQLKPANP